MRCEAVNAILLNEFRKERRKVEQEEATIAQLKSALAKQETVDAEQQKQIEALTAALKEQATQIRAVSDQLQANKPAAQLALNN